MSIPNKGKPLEGFEVYRKQILSQSWSQGLSVEEVKNYLDRLEDSRFGSILYRSNHDYPYLQPRGGFPTFQQQKSLSEALDRAGADILPLTIDSYTRHNDYEKAGFLLSKSEEEGKDYLNGYPLVNHGYELSRQLYQNIKKPVCIRHGTPDARLLVEMAVATGITEIEGGALVYCLPYSEGFPIDQAILYWQYVDQVCADYSTEQRPIHRESFGPLTATMVPPMMVIVIQLIELLLAAEQGIKSFGVSFGQTGSFTQDIALGSVLTEKAKQYLNCFGFSDIHISLVYNQWMGAFPSDRVKAMALISMSAVIAKLIAADKIVIKTKDEAFGIPTIDANCEALGQVRYIFEKLPGMNMINSEAIALETELLSNEVNYIMEVIFNLPGDAFWESVLQAFRQGFIDVPFSPHCMNPNQLLTIRDHYHSIRIQDPGKVPIRSQDLKQERALIKTQLDQDRSYFDKIERDINTMI